MSQEEFDKAAEQVKVLKGEPTQEEKLKVYGLYKQVTVGDINIAQPWAVQMEARAKWDAWNANKGKSRDDAIAAYIALVDQLVNKYGV